ncbi:MAG: hypothetical protein MI702_07440, partial [Chlorobiales bacterium]|nr:hypothetical protein [Chlorobiales bacterium]
SARNSLPQNKQDNFLLGLFQGHSYPPLVAALLERGAKELNSDSETDIRDMAADFMKKTAKIIKDKPDFEDFFQEHWGDLLRAGFTSVEMYGTTLLGDKKLLGQILQRVAGDLAKHNNSKLLGADALYGIVNSTAAVVAAQPELASNLLGPNRRWIDLLVTSVAHTINEHGTGKIFTKAGVEALFKQSFATFSEHPELIAGDSELGAKLVGGVLKSLAQSDSYAAADLAQTAITAALDTLAANPALIKFDYSELAASFAGTVANLVKTKKISRIEANDILDEAISALVKNPELFLKLEDKLAEGVLEAVFAALGTESNDLVVGAALSQLISEVVSALAKTGKAALKNHPLQELVAQLEAVITAGLKRAQSELGHTLDLPTVPVAIGLLIEAWAKGHVATLDPDNDNFRALFAELSARAAA